MGLVIYFFGGGAAFFVGAGLVLAAAALPAVSRRPRLSRFAAPLAVLGLILVLLSATPLPYWFYAAAAVVTLPWLAAEEWGKGALVRRRGLLRGAAAAVWLAAVALEARHHLAPVVPAAGGPPLYVIGDSLTAGMGEDGTETWPRLLARRQGIEVHDFSRVGATASSALRQAERLPEEGGLVLVEIGGNDLLGSTPTGRFERDLDLLLGRVCAPGRVVLMFELPLPPLCNGYGLAQRRLAARYSVGLIPRRALAGLLAAGGATVDSVHLTPEGHERMAEVVWGLIRPAYGEGRNQ
jgi:acyl-CoA thioesterase-1